jgi:phosphoribosylamine---glycine ligase
MKDILIIGSGGREHALGWALRKSPEAGRIWFAPGNAGTARLERAENVPLAAEDIDGLVRLAEIKKPALIVVGPEAPLAAGLADRLRAKGFAVFGPDAAAAQIEASKSWAKDFMARHNIPTAAQATFENPNDAITYLKRQPAPYVIKADGLAAGKGVLVTENLPEAEAFINEALGGGLFGAAGKRILIEEFMQGVEVSVLALCDTVSERIIALEPACDYKRAFDGDAGPNTGGMGAFSPPAFMTSQLRQRIEDEILLPALAGFITERVEYRGTLYAGLMITNGRPRVVEFNCRFGDPETQVILPRLNSDLLQLLELTAHGKLSQAPEINWQPGGSVGVVLAAGGYPGAYAKNQPVRGLDNLQLPPNVQLFHAGTSFDAMRQPITSGGRVFNLVAIGENLADARQQVYNILSEQSFGFEGMRYRSDIAAGK